MQDDLKKERRVSILIKWGICGVGVYFVLLVASFIFFRCHYDCPPFTMWPTLVISKVFLLDLLFGIGFAEPFYISSQYNFLHFIAWFLYAIFFVAMGIVVQLFKKNKKTIFVLIILVFIFFALRFGLGSSSVFIHSDQSTVASVSYQDLFPNNYQKCESGFVNDRDKEIILQTVTIKNNGPVNYKEDFSGFSACLYPFGSLENDEKQKSTFAVFHKYEGVHARSYGGFKFIAPKFSQKTIHLKLAPLCGERKFNTQTYSHILLMEGSLYKKTSTGGKGNRCAYATPEQIENGVKIKIE